MADKLPKLLTTGEVAELLGVEQQTIGQWCRWGKFPNAQRVGRGKFWIIPAGDLALLEPKPPQEPTRRLRLSPLEYAAYGLQVVKSWKKSPPVLRCPTCGEQWRSWDWRCPTGCNADAKPPAAVDLPGQVVRDARLNAGLLQYELARAVGVSTGTVNNWEQRGSVPSDPERRRKVAEVLGVDPWGGGDHD